MYKSEQHEKRKSDAENQNHNISTNHCETRAATMEQAVKTKQHHLVVESTKGHSGYHENLVLF